MAWWRPPGTRSRRLWAGTVRQGERWKSGGTGNALERWKDCATFPPSRPVPCASLDPPAAAPRSPRQPSSSLSLYYLLPLRGEREGTVGKGQLRWRRRVPPPRERWGYGGGTPPWARGAGMQHLHVLRLWKKGPPTAPAADLGRNRPPRKGHPGMARRTPAPMGSQDPARSTHLAERFRGRPAHSVHGTFCMWTEGTGEPQHAAPRRDLRPGEHRGPDA